MPLSRVISQDKITSMMVFWRPTASSNGDVLQTGKSFIRTKKKGHEEGFCIQCLEEHFCSQQQSSR
jgi:hypothetical protein